MTPDPTVTAVSEYIPIKDLADLEDRLALWCQISEPSPLVKHSSVKEMLTASRDAVRELLRARSALADVGDDNVIVSRNMLERACSWFQIQEVAHPQLGAKARSIWEWMQKALAGTAKQPRPAAEAKCARCGDAKRIEQMPAPKGMKDKSSPPASYWIDCPDCSPAAHTAQFTGGERDALSAGAILLEHHAAGLPAAHPWHECAATLRRLAEQRPTAAHTAQVTAHWVPWSPAEPAPQPCFHTRYLCSVRRMGTIDPSWLAIRDGHAFDDGTSTEVVAYWSEPLPPAYSRLAEQGSGAKESAEGDK